MADELTPRVTDEDLLALLRQYPDIFKSLGSGAARGAIDVVGTPGDLGHMLNQGIDYGVAQVGRAFGKDWGQPVGEPPLGTDAITRGVQNYTGDFYPPQTRAGELAEQGGRLAAQSIGGGPFLKAMQRDTTANFARARDTWREILTNRLL